MLAPMRDMRSVLAAISRRVRPGSGAAAPSSPATDALVTRMAELTGRREHTEALALATEAFRKHPRDLAVVKQVRTTATKAGALTLLNEATQVQLELAPNDSLRTRARIQEGRLRETSAGWLPDPGPRSPVQQRVAGRVLHVLKISMPHRQSGYSVRTMYTLAGQLQAGLDPIGATALDFPRTVGITDAPVEEEVEGVRHLRLYREEIPADEPADLYLEAWARALADVAERERPQVIHVHSGHRGFESALVALAVGRALRIPVVYEVRGFFEALWTSDADWAERSETYDRRFATEKWCMEQADAVVTLSASMRDDIVARGIDASRVHVVPNGVDIDSFAPRERDAALAGQLGLQDRFVFGYVSNLDHWREGHELLVEAAAILAGRGIPATALIVGDGSRRAELEELARTSGATDVVHFTGRVPHDQVLDYYAQYDAFVIPRVDERAARLVTPLKPFEAMAAQIPVVVSDLPALTEITGHGERGATFEVGSAQSLADTLEGLYRDPACRDELARAGRAWVVAERQWVHNADRYRAVYEAADPTS